MQTSGLSHASGSDLPRGPARPYLITLEAGSSGACAGQQIILASQAGSAREAREFTMAALRAWRLGTMADAAMIVVSELVTNAIVHGSCHDADADEPGQVVLALHRAGDRVTIIATDGNANPPVLAVPPDPSAESGRGLSVVDALAEQWGWTRLGVAAKAVWATLCL